MGLKTNRKKLNSDNENHCNVKTPLLGTAQKKNKFKFTSNQMSRNEPKSNQTYREMPKK